MNLGEFKKKMANFVVIRSNRFLIFKKIKKISDQLRWFLMN